VWLDEQRIHVGESITGRINQGLAESDFFVVALSMGSVDSERVKKELNGALIEEAERRKITDFPIKLDDCEIPTILKDQSRESWARWPCHVPP